MTDSATSLPAGTHLPPKNLPGGYPTPAWRGYRPPAAPGGYQPATGPSLAAIPPPPPTGG